MVTAELKDQHFWNLNIVQELIYIVLYPVGAGR